MRGVGETPIVPPLGAIANAMEQATGIRFTELPMSPPKVLKALKEKGLEQGLAARMARVVLVGNLAQVTGGVAEFQLSATSVQQLFRQLGELHPAIAPHLESGVAVAIDGQIYQDALLRADRPRQRGVPAPADRGRLSPAERRRGSARGPRRAIDLVGLARDAAVAQ